MESLATTGYTSIPTPNTSDYYSSQNLPINVLSASYRPPSPAFDVRSTTSSEKMSKGKLRPKARRPKFDRIASDGPEDPESLGVPGGSTHGQSNTSSEDLRRHRTDWQPTYTPLDKYANPNLPSGSGKTPSYVASAINLSPLPGPDGPFKSTTVNQERVRIDQAASTIRDFEPQAVFQKALLRKYYTFTEIREWPLLHWPGLSCMSLN